MFELPARHSTPVPKNCQNTPCKRLNRGTKFGWPRASKNRRYWEEISAQAWLDRDYRVEASLKAQMPDQVYFNRPPASMAGGTEE
jgi:hypothetical protein